METNKFKDFLLNESVSKEKIMRHIRWDDYIFNFFNTYDFFMGADPAANINIRNGQKVAEKAMALLSQFFDMTPTLDQYKNQWEKEQRKIARM